MGNRLIQIYDVASSLFINKGYSRTQIKDIAQGIGISVGTMYHYFVGKADILSFILKVTIEPAFVERDFEFPVDAKLFSTLQDDIKATFESRSRLFAEPYSKKDKSYTFDKMISDAFDTVAQYGKGFLLIENNPDDVGSIAELYRDYRQEFYNQMLNYVSYFKSVGTFRTVRYPEHATRLIIETIAWWGMHVMNDAYTPQKDIPIEIAKQVCMDALINAYMIEK